LPLDDILKSIGAGPVRHTRDIMNVKIILVAILAASISSQFSSQSLAQEPAAGEVVFKQCNICHQVGENAKNEVGPVLNGIIGRKAGTASGFEYSPGFKSADLVWDDASFREYIRDPRSMFPATKMVFAGLKDERKIADLLAYLKSFAADGKRSR
jgi:cytochrome c